MPDLVSPTSSVETKERIKRVGGWIWIFLMGCVIGGLSDVFVCILSPSPINLFLVMILLILRALVVTTVLKVSPHAIRNVKIFLIAMFIASVINLIRAFTLPPTQFNETDLQNLRAIGARGLLSTVIWAQYFRNSKRVKDTFGMNLQ
jgi:uncharacterized membrane protein